jgi:hypothetical protein
MLISNFFTKKKKEGKKYGEWITSDNVEREETVGRLLSCLASATWR